MACFECGLLQLQGVQFEVVYNCHGEHIRNYVRPVESDQSMKEE